MIKTIENLAFEYKGYANLYDKIRREEHSGKLFKLKRGLYETSATADPFTIANALTSPSYISFETALSFYGLIPERVYLIRSATYKKNKTKKFENRFGTFHYQDVEKNAYPFGIDIIKIDDRPVMIASKEKALLDMLSVLSPRNNLTELKNLLFDDLRIDETLFDDLDKQTLLDLSAHYSSLNVKLFRKYLGR